MREATLAWVVAIFAQGCEGAHPSAVASTAPSTPAVAAASPPDAAVPGPLEWAEAIRRERWPEAAAQIDALPQPSRAKPEVAYARARAAIAMGDAKLALELLTALEQELPLLTSDIQRWRAEAESAVGPYAEAAGYFAARGSPDAWIKAARAYERSGEPARARAQCERVLLSDHRSRLQEAAARGLRARVAEGANDRTTASLDARWIAVHAPDSVGAKDAEGALARIAADRPLTAEELMTRARVLADAGRTDDALRTLDRVTSVASSRVSKLDELHARADILYKTRGRSLEAAKVLDECAAVGGAHALEDDFHAARALARADHDDEAILRMSLIARHHPGTTWGDEAQYFVSYLRLLHGEWKAAAAGFDEYAQRYPKGVERHEALRYRAMAHLMNQSYNTARKLFEQAAAEETDPLAAARSLSMAALGALRDGDRLHAIARWSEVARSQPLSWPALVARTRLAEAGAPVPRVFETGSASPDAPPFPVPLPPPVELLHAIGLDADAEAALEERESVVTAHAPAGRSLEALCAAYGKVGRGKRRFQLTRQMPVGILASAPSQATRWAWECAYPEPYVDAVFEHAGADEASASLVYAVMRQESSFDPDAISPAHAVGLMQLLPETARSVAATIPRPYDDSRLPTPDTNIALGARYLRDLRGRLGDQTALAVAAYNAGEDSIQRWLGRAPGMDVDVFVERIPYAETRSYVARVMGNFARYEYLRKGEAGVPTVSLKLGR